METEVEIVRPKVRADYKRMTPAEFLAHELDMHRLPANWSLAEFIAWQAQQRSRENEHHQRRIMALDDTLTELKALLASAVALAEKADQDLASVTRTAP